MPDYTYVGKRIRELREQKHYTREELADKLAISSRLLYEIESGKKSFSTDLLCELAFALSVSCDYILFGELTNFEKREKITTLVEQMDTRQILMLQYIVEKMRELCDLL